MPNNPPAIPGNCEVCSRPIKGSRGRRRCRVCSRGHTNDEEQRAYQLLRKYGITVTEYDAMLEAQDGRCAICGSLPTGSARSGRSRLVVDHDHKTARVRGLLCQGCNTGLGGFYDSIEVVQSAIAYLENPPAVRTLYFQRLARSLGG